MATKLNLKINQGETYRHAITWKDAATDLPINITGYSGRMHIRGTVASVTTYVELTTENNGLLITDAVNGELTIYMSDSTTTGFNWYAGVYDLELIAPNGGDVFRVIEGSVSVKKEVTR